MDSFTVQVNSKNLERAMRLFPAELKMNMADAFDHASRKFFKTFYRTRLQGPPGVKGTSGGLFHRFRRVVLINGKPKFLNANMRRDMTTSLIGKSDDVMNMQIDMYTKSKAAGIHEKGGDVGGKGKYMKIPLPTAKKLRANVKLIALKLRGGLFLVQVNRRQKALTPFFILKNRVHMTPRLGFYSTWGGLSSQRIKVIDKAIKDTITGTKL